MSIIQPPREKDSRLRLPSTSPAATGVLVEILTRGPIPRVEVARRTGLSQAAVTKAATPLIDAGFVTQKPVASPGAIGRPATPLQVRPDSAYFVGIKVLPTEIVATLIDFHTDPVENVRIALATHSLADVVAGAEQAVHRLLSSWERPAEATGGIAGIGIAVSGDVEVSTGTVRHSPLLGWRDAPLGRALAERVGLPVSVDNDVRALTYAENWFGVGRGSESFALITLGSGIGCGLFLNGRVVQGAYGVAGEIGHLPLAPATLTCVCGMRGCVETIAASDSIARAVRDRTGRADLDYADAVELARNGNAAAKQAFAHAGTVLGAAIATVVNIAGPERIIIGGEGAFEYDLFETELHDAFGAHAFGAASNCDIVVIRQGFDAWARGAAVSFLRAFVMQD